MIQQPNRPRPAPDASKPNRFFPELVTTMRDTLLVTYAVPVEGACELLPSGFVPDLLPIADSDGNNARVVAFAQCLYSRIENIRPTARWGGLAGVTTLRLTLRLLVRHEQKPGAFLLRQFISDRTGSASLLPLRLLVSNVERARITAHITGNPTLPLCETCHIETLTPALRLTLSAARPAVTPRPDETPLSSAALWDGYRDLLTFFSTRENLYSAARRRDHIVHIVQTPLNPENSSPNNADTDAVPDATSGETSTETIQPTAFLPLRLTHARLPLLTRWFGLTEPELLTPVAVHWQSTQSVRLSAPRLLKIPSDS